MRITPISEALEQVGAIIPCIQGKITTCYNHESKDGQHGPYTLQALTIQDGTGEIRIALFDQRDMKPFKGKNMILTSGKDKNGKLVGVLVQEREYKGKKSIELKVSSQAHIEAGVESINGHSPDPTYPLPMAMPEDATDEEKVALEALAKARADKAKKLHEEAAAKARSDSGLVSDTKGPSSYPDAKRRIVQISNLYDYALKTAKRALQKHGLELTDIYTATATVFIAMRDDGLTDGMPMALIEDRIPTAAEMYPPLKESDPAVQPDPEPEVDQEPASWKEVKYNGRPLGEMEITELDFLFTTFKPKPVNGNYDIKDLYIVNALKTWKKETL